MKTAIFLLTLAPGMACLAQPVDQDRQQDTPATTQVIEQQPVKRSRLKFRNGPVCMCNDGLSEADIQAAKMKRAEE